MHGISYSGILNALYYVSKYQQTRNRETSGLIGKFCGKFFASSVRKLAWAATISYLWQERNSRVFKGIQRSPEVVVATIFFNIRITCSQLASVKCNLFNHSTCNLWNINIPPNILSYFGYTSLFSNYTFILVPQSLTHKYTNSLTLGVGATHYAHTHTHGVCGPRT